jgi:transposase
MYGSDLTHAQWGYIAFFFHRQTFQRHHPRTVVNAILYISKTGRQWRMLPKEAYPPWPTAYYHFRQWTRSGLWKRLNDALRRAERAS